MDTPFFQLVQEGPSQGETVETRLPLRLAFSSSQPDLPRLRNAFNPPSVDYFKTGNIYAYRDYANLTDQYVSYNLDLFYSRETANLPFGLQDDRNVHEKKGFTHIEHLLEAYPDAEMILHLGRDFHKTPTRTEINTYIGLDNSHRVVFCLEESSARPPGSIRVPITYKLIDRDGQFEKTLTPSSFMYIGEGVLIHNIKEQGEEEQDEKVSLDPTQLIEGYLQAFNEVLA